MAQYLTGNRLCDQIPTEVDKLSSQVTGAWSVASGNDLLGSPCTWPAIPTSLPSDTSAIDYAGLSLTGSIPTQLALYTLVTSLNLANNTLSGTIPSGTFVSRERYTALRAPFRNRYGTKTDHAQLPSFFLLP